MQTHDHDQETSGLEYALTLIGSAIALVALVAIASQVPDLLLALIH
jgi:hypothetical protein